MKKVKTDHAQQFPEAPATEPGIRGTRFLQRRRLIGAWASEPCEQLQTLIRVQSGSEEKLDAEISGRNKLPVEDPETGDVLAVIETPRGSRNKYAFDEDLGTFRLKAILPQGNVCPFDFGFIPSGDGDPLDLLVLLEDSVPMGCAISVRLIGAIERPGSATIAPSALRRMPMCTQT